MDYKARFYSPLLGRFIQPDSVVPNTQNVQSLNRFTYVNNSPLIFNDPSGHCELACVLALVGLAVSITQIPSDVQHDCSPAQPCGDEAVFEAGLALYVAAPEIAVMTGDVLMGFGRLFNSPRLWTAGYSVTNAASTEIAAAGNIKNPSTQRFRIPTPENIDDDLITTRPTFWRAGTRPTVEASTARDSLGNMRCLGCNSVMNHPDLDHYPPVSVRIKTRTYDTRQEFLDDYFNVGELRGLCLICNRSHRFEQTPNEKMPFFNLYFGGGK